VTRDGKTVRVEIYEAGEGGWLLEVVDDYGNSTVWDDPFATDQGALDEVLKAVNEEGIDSLIGSPPDGQQMTGLDQPLSEAELNELDDFLADAANEDTSMDVSTLEGFLTAIAIGPHMVPPSEWLPWVWDMEEGEATADFENEAQANQIMSLILRLYNYVNHSFNTDPASFEPIFWRGVSGARPNGAKVSLLASCSTKRRGACYLWDNRHGSRHFCASVPTRVSKLPRALVMPRPG
jgi:uncharacterized protein